MLHVLVYKYFREVLSTSPFTLPCACASLATPTDAVSLCLVWLQFSLDRDRRNFCPKNIIPSITDCHSSLIFPQHFMLYIEIKLGSLCLELFSCLHLQPSLPSIPPFCLGCVPDLLPSSCLYLHKRLFLVSFPVLFRLQDNLPSWPFSANSNASLKHSSVRLFSNEPSYHPNTSLLPWVPIHILITDQFQQTPVSEILKICRFLTRQCRLHLKLSFTPDLTHICFIIAYTPLTTVKLFLVCTVVTCDQNQAYCLSLDIKTMTH